MNNMNNIPDEYDIADIENNNKENNNLLKLIIFDCKNYLNNVVEYIIILSKFLMIIGCFIIIIMIFKIMQFIFNK